MWEGSERGGGGEEGGECGKGERGDEVGRGKRRPRLRLYLRAQ